jgi:hypothetical protein
MIKHTSLLLLPFVFVNLTSLATANELDLRINDDSLNLNYSIESHASSLVYGLGYFFKDSTDSASVANFDLHSKGPVDIGNLEAIAGLGIQANLFKEGDIDGAAFGLGGTISVKVLSTHDLWIESALHYAPDILAFGDSDDFLRFLVQIDYGVTENASASLGFQSIKAGIKSGDDQTLESSLFLGMKLKF